MPLFGKSKEEKKEKGSPSKGYPTLQPAYPTQQPAYPTQQPAYSYPGQQQPAYNPYPGQQQPAYPYPGQQPMAGEQPPPYSPYPQNGPAAPAPMGAYPQHPLGAYPQQAPMGAYAQPPVMGAYAQPPVMGAYPQAVPPVTVPCALGSYDAGARFGAGATTNIPPPPPGSLPNMAQMAASQGQNVVVNQEKATWLSGGSGAGFTFW